MRLRDTRVEREPQTIPALEPAPGTLPVRYGRPSLSDLRPKNGFDYDVVWLTFLQFQCALARIFASPDFNEAWKGVTARRHCI